MYKIFLFVFILSFILEAKMLTRTQIIMGTYVSISVEEVDASYIEDGFQILKSIDESISSYKHNSPIFKLNRDKKSYIDKNTYEALLLSQKYYQKSDGYFDITIGSITKDLFSFGADERVPTKKELQDSTINFNGLVFDDKSASIQKEMKVDLGGMGKGFGVDKVNSNFKSRKIQHAIIAASGDIRCINLCKLEVKSPFNDSVLGSFTTLNKDTAVSTSGNYNRYVESSKNNHLINPKLKVSQDKFISITLISHMNNSDLDAYATASSVMPIKLAYKFLNDLDLAYIILQSNGELIISENISEFTKNLTLNYTRK